MKELIEYLIKNIVNNPDKVEISEEKTNEGSNMQGVIFNVKVDQSDMGLVIGKNGQTIKSIRNIARIKAIKEKIALDIRLVETPKEE